MYQEHTGDAIRHLWATVHIYNSGISPERPYLFTGRSTYYEPQAIKLAAREAIVQLWHLSLRVNCRSFSYYLSREGYSRPPEVTNRENETDFTLLHLVCFIRAQEALYEHVTLDLIAVRGELSRQTPRRREAEPDATNPVVFFGRSIEPLRSTPAADHNHAHISLEQLCHILGFFSNGAVATTPSNGRHLYRSLVSTHPTPRNHDTVVPEASTCARPTRLDVNEVD